MERISIVIPLYNKQDTILQTVESIRRQTYQDFEIVVVDDGSTDDSVKLIRGIEDSRIRVVAQANCGVSVARNSGIKESRGEFIAFLDADDEWDKDYLETQMGLLMDFPGCNVTATNYRFKDDQGRISHTILNKIPFEGERGILSNYFEVCSCSHAPVCSSAVLIKKQCLEQIGGFPPGIKSGEDLLTWARLAVGNKIAFTVVPHATYNVGKQLDYSRLPVRRPDCGDPVGQELKKLYEEHKDISDLKKYLSHWHKMRASVAIRFGERRETLYESFSALKYNVFNYKVIPFIILALLPSTLRNKIIRMKNH